MVARINFDQFCSFFLRLLLLLLLLSFVVLCLCGKRVGKTSRVTREKKKHNIMILQWKLDYHENQILYYDIVEVKVFAGKTKVILITSAITRQMQCVCLSVSVSMSASVYA